MSDATGRPQDQSRSHRRRGKPSAETVSLLARYQAAMRDDLAAVLDELRPVPPPPGLLDDADQPTAPKRPALRDRAAMWDLAIRLGRELGTAVDVGASDVDKPAASSGPRRRSRVDYG